MLFGARRVGKTRLIENYLATVPEQKWYTGHGEDRDLAELLVARSASRLRQLFSRYDGFFLELPRSATNWRASRTPSLPASTRRGLPISRHFSVRTTSQRSETTRPNNTRRSSNRQRTLTERTRKLLTNQQSHGRALPRPSGKSFVLFRISGFSRNLRKEVSKTMRYYFVDNGIRNAVINHFQPISQRTDRGALWENFFVNECRRQHAYTNTGTKDYFWRTYDQQEIDLIEVSSDGSLEAFECKWQDKKHRTPGAWKKAYPAPPRPICTPKELNEFPQLILNLLNSQFLHAEYHLQSAQKQPWY